MSPKAGKMEGGGGREENAVETCVKRTVLQSSPFRGRSGMQFIVPMSILRGGNVLLL